MSSEIALYRPPERELAQSSFEIMPLAIRLAEELANTEFVPAGLRNNKPAIMAAILTGHEVGLQPMAALREVHVIKGRPGLSANAMRALVLSHGHFLRFSEQTNTRVTIHGRRRGENNETSVTWTMDDAQRAGLAGKDTWKGYPRALLIARATGELCRAIFADVIAGMPYSKEELEDFTEDATRSTLPQEPQDGATPAADAPKRTARRTRRETAPPPAPPLPQDDGAPPAPPLPGEEADPGPESNVAEPAAPPADPPRAAGPGPQAPAGEPAPGENLTLAQQIALHCREAGFDRKHLLLAITGKESGREITREQAQAVLEAAKAIARGEARLEEHDGTWAVQLLIPGSAGEEG
jgi:hypothetical protein